VKLVGLSHRVDFIESYGERRDSIDQQWYKFVSNLGALPISLPNLSKEDITPLLNKLELDAIILTGGNSLSTLEPLANDAAPERDEFEIKLIKHALEKKIPLIGVCRGMQIINQYFGGSLAKITGHVAVRHPIISEDSSYKMPKNVNSFHNWSIPHYGLAELLITLAKDEVGNIEAYRSEDHKVLGIMWHPERERPFLENDIQLIKRIIL